MVPFVMLTANASGAAQAARSGQVVMIVDVIDMSTTLEAALDEGALIVYGAAPDNAKPPVSIDPFKVSLRAGEYASSRNTGIIVLAEPRVGLPGERISGIQKVLEGITKSGARIEAVLPNLGAETFRLTSVKGRVIVAATGSGGVAFDAALTAGAPAVLTGTVARTFKKKGLEPAKAAADRAYRAARLHNTGIAVVAASSNSLEDMLAAEFIFKLLMAK